MAMRDKIEHAIQNQPCTVKDLKSKVRRGPQLRTAR